MILDFNIAILFSVHLMLFIVKVWAFIFLFKNIIITETPKTDRYMIIFKPIEILIILMTFFTVIFEIYFFINFFVDVKLYFYEYLAILDQVFLTILVIAYLKKEVNSNG